MSAKKIWSYTKKRFTVQNYHNIVEALYVSQFIRKIGGMSIFFVEIGQDHRIVQRFSWIGLLFYSLWYSLFYYCFYKAYVEGQTMLRTIYNTKLQRYADDVEVFTSLLFILTTMWKLPLCSNDIIHVVQNVFDIDKDLKNLGEQIDYNKDAYLALAISFGHVVLYLLRVLSIWRIFHSINMPVPSERMYQVIFSDAQTLMWMSTFCYYLILFRSRFKYINNVLDGIIPQQNGSYTLFIGGSIVTNISRSENNKEICEKIQKCSKIYGTMFKLADFTNKMFNVILALTMFISLLHIIMYLFYFMEATAAGLYHDVPRYVNFMVYVLWQIFFSCAVVYMVVYFCEGVMEEAKNTSFIAHVIVNSDFSSNVKSEAMQLSLQLLHQKVVFSGAGLFELNYALLHQSTMLPLNSPSISSEHDDAWRMFGRSVFTYLVILVQFVTDV